MSFKYKSRPIPATHTTTTTNKAGEGTKPSPARLSAADVMAEKQQIASLFNKIQKAFQEPKVVQKAATILSLWINRK